MTCCVVASWLFTVLACSPSGHGTDKHKPFVTKSQSEHGPADRAVAAILDLCFPEEIEQLQDCIQVLKQNTHTHTAAISLQ